ncbi:DUF1656 domain-containing protein [Methylocella sp.]|uniref:DUF1656 domain-containing protein n=1 Tax=Methylocella sp. TaxID=1978226 RepID=UPI00378465F7
MSFPLREVDLLGVYVAPFALCLPIAFAATCAALALLRRAPGLAVAARTPALELGLFVALLSGLTLLLGR